MKLNEFFLKKMVLICLGLVSSAAVAGPSCRDLFRGSIPHFTATDLVLVEISYQNSLPALTVVQATASRRSGEGFQVVQVVPPEISHILDSPTDALLVRMQIDGLAQLNYRGRVDSAVTKIVKKIDASLPPERSITHFVYDLFQNLLGSIRFFFGSPKTSDLRYVELPCQRILRELGVPQVQSIAQLQQLGLPYIELFNFNHHPDLKGQQLEIVRDTTERALYIRLLQLPPNTVVLAHVATPVHERAYKRDFGFLEKPLETFVIGDTTHKIMATTATALAERLRDRIATRGGKFWSLQLKNALNPSSH